MASVAIDLNDAGLTVAQDGQAWSAGPAYAASIDGSLRFGAEAAAVIRLSPRLAQRRYWAELAETPLPTPLGGCRTGADLLQRHLRDIWARCAGADGAVLAVMPGWSTAQLALLLGIARDIGMPVTGLVDAAVAASRRPYPGQVLWNLQFALHSATVSRIEQGAAATLGERMRVERLGIEALELGCMQFLAQCFVDCSRFDPLQDARSEQALSARMSEWLPEAAREERVSMALEHAGNRFEAWFNAADLRQHVARLVEPLTQRLRAALSPREPAVLQVESRLAEFPGTGRGADPAARLHRGATGAGGRSPGCAAGVRPGKRRGGRWPDHGTALGSAGAGRRAGQCRRRGPGADPRDLWRPRLAPVRRAIADRHG